MAKLTIIRFDLNSPDGYDVNRLPEGIKGDPHLMMWKELCRSGVYETSGVKHNIDRAFLENIVKTFWERKAKGIEVPCPVGHTHDPEAKRGRVVYVELREGKDGSISLYGIIEFVDHNAKRTLCNSGVSIEAPEVVTDGDGETHKYGLEHVAFTDYPVVAGMEGFRDVVFSIIKKKEKKKMGKKRKKFSDETEFEKCPNCGHEFDEDIGNDEDVQQSRRYSRRFADDEDVVQGRRYGRRYGRRFADDTEFDDDIIQSRRYGRRFADDAEFDDDAEFTTCPNCGHEFDDILYGDDEDLEAEIEDVRQSRRYGRSFADDLAYEDDVAYADDVIYDDDPVDEIKQSRRYSRRCSRFDDIDPAEEIRQSRRYGRRFDDLAYGDDEDIRQSRKRCSRRFTDDEELGDDMDDVVQSRYGRRCSRFDDLVDLDDVDIDEEVDVRQSRRYGRRFDDVVDVDEDEDVVEDVKQSRRYGRRFDDTVNEDEDGEKHFADEVQYDEMPVKNALQVETEKRCADKKFSLSEADTVSANILKENRELQVQNLLSSGKINRIQAKQILDRFCNQSAISFSINSGDNSEFKNVIELMKSGIGADYSEKTGVQFSNPVNDRNELLEEIERRHANKNG